jgi:hypothetical protein
VSSPHNNMQQFLPRRQSFTATGGQTTFTITGGYTPDYIDVYQNGIKLTNGTDVTVTSGSTVVLASGATAGDEVSVVAYSAMGVLSNEFDTDVTINGDLTVTGAITQGSSGASVPMYYIDDTTGSSSNFVSSRGVNFENIPSWVRKIELTVWRPSTNGSTDSFLLRIGDSGGLETTGYEGVCNNASGGTTNYQTGFWPLLATTTNTASRFYPMTIRLWCADPGTQTQWVVQSHTHVDTGGAAGIHTTTGYKTLSGALTKVRVGLTGSTDTFDNGHVVLTAWG